MAISRIKNWVAEVLTDEDLNAEFNNIINNATALISPLTADLAFGGFRLTGLALGTVGSPALQFTGDANTGVYSSGADTVDLAGGGLRLMTLTSTPSAGIVSTDPGAITATAATNVARFFVGGTSALTIPAGTTSIVAGAWIAEPNLTATGTITSAATVYAPAAPTEATNNYALWMDAGVSRLDNALGFLGGSDASQAIMYGSGFALTFHSGINAAFGSNAERMRLTDGGILALGTTVTTGAAAGDHVSSNGGAYRLLNAAGTTSANYGILGSAAANLLDAAVPAATDQIGFVFAGDRQIRMQSENGGAGLQWLAESSADHAAPAANRAVLYTRDVAGKTQIVARFSTGAVQVVAAEP